jgi:hypothetical protein
MGIGAVGDVEADVVVRQRRQSSGERVELDIENDPDWIGVRPLQGV